MTPRSTPSYTVLVVDDDPSVLATYRRLLRRAGYVTVVEEDPRRVLETGHAEGPIDLLVLDFKMPQMDGLSLLAELRRRECRAPCVLLSAYINDDVESRARMLGVARILEKPVDARALRGVLNDLLTTSDAAGAATMERSNG